MVPTLTVYSILIGIWGGAMIATTYLGVASEIYYKRLYEGLARMDVFHGMAKTVVFAIIISVVCCHMGLTTERGAEGVGKSTMRAVVISLTAILICDYFMARFVPTG
jgi:phospholipid/cholesterol/gamma-HCH transport system permease protein